MKSPEESLVSLGLTKTEAKLYLAGLTTNSTTAQELARTTRIKRPTVYHALSTLREKGLVSDVQTIGKAKIQMSRPESMQGVIEMQKEEVEQRAKSLSDLLPVLAEIAAAKQGEGVSVVHYTGIEGMKLVMDMAFHCRSKQWDIIAPYNNFLREYDADYAKRYLNARKYHGITSRTLWEDTQRPGRTLTAEDKRERNPRLMPWVMHGKFKSMMILFDDKVAIFSSLDTLSAILITSKDVHALCSAMFEGLWDASEGY